MIDFHSQLSIIPEGYESATLQDNLEHSGGITLSWKAASDAEIPLGSYITYEKISYILLEPYAPTKESTIHWHYNPTFKHPQNMLGRIPFWVKSLDASGTPVNLQTTSFTGYPETIVAKLCSFINTEYVAETSDSFFASTVGTGWSFSIPNANNEKHAIITVAFDGCSIKSAADRIGDAMGCNVFFDWSAKVIRFVVGTTIQGEAYNTFHVLGGTKNMGKTTVSGGFAAVTQRLTLPDSYKGSIISYAENNGIRLTTDLIFDEIYPKQELFIKTARQRLCYLTDNESGEFIVDHWEKDGVVVSQDTKGAKPVFKTFAKWYVTLATDRELQNDYVFNQEYLIKDKPLGLLFQIDDQQMPKLVGHEFELTYYPGPEAKEEYDRNDAEATAKEPFVISAHEYYIACKAVGEMLLPTTLTDGAGLVPRVKDKVTLVNMALNDEQKGIAKRELLAAAQEIIGAMMAQKGEYTETVLNAQGIAIGGASPFTSDHGPIVTNINQNLDTGVAEVTVGSWSRKTKTGGTVDKLETVTVSASNPTEGDGGLGGNSSKTIGQTLLKPDSLFSIVLGNSMDVVSCDSDGKTKLATDVWTKVTAFYGNRDVTASSTILYTSDLPNGVTMYQEKALPVVSAEGEEGEEPATNTGTPMTKDTEVALDNGAWIRVHFNEGITFGDKLDIDFIGSHPSFTDRNVKMTIQCMRPGESRIGIDLDNDADVVSVDENGKVRFDRTVVTKAYIYDGGSAVTEGVTIPDTMTAASLKIGGCTPTISNVVNGEVTITWAFETGDSASSVEKTISLTYKNRTYSTIFSFVALDSATIYQLQPSLKAISFARKASDNSLEPPSRDLSLAITKFDGQGTDTIDSCPSGYSVIYGLDNPISDVSDDDSWPVKNNKFDTLTINNSTENKNIYIALFYNQGTKHIKVDYETIPIIKDGFNGDGIVSVTRTYARSTQSTTSSETTPPTIDGTWAASSPAVNEVYPYLWAREEVVYKYQAKTIKYYMIGARGQNGIDAQDIEWVYIRTKTPIAPVIYDDEHYTDSHTPTGRDYTKDDHLPRVNGTSRNTSSSFDIEVNGGTWQYPECTDDPKGVNDTWKYEWEIKREKGGKDAYGHRDWVAYSGDMTMHNNLAESALVIDIDNDNDQFGTDSESRVIDAQMRITVATLLYGTQEQEFLTTPQASAPSVSLKYDDGSPVPTSVAEVAGVLQNSNKEYKVTVTIKETTGSSPYPFASHNGLYVDISGKCAKGGTKSIRFTLEKVMSGEKGVSPTIYQLAPTLKAFSFSRNETNNELKPNTITSQIKVAETIGNVTTIKTLAESGKTFTWGFDGSFTGGTITETDKIAISNSNASEHREVCVELSTGDKETLPITKDGKAGDNSVRIDLDNQADMVSVDTNGKVRFDHTVTVNAKIYDGSTPVTSDDKITHSMTATSLKIGSRNAETPTKSGGCVTVQWKFKKGDTVSATPVTITLRYNSVDYSAVFTLGTTDSEAFYQLLPSRDSINFTRQADGSLTPDAVYPYCGYVKYTGSGAESHPLQYEVTQNEIFNFDNSGYAIWFRFLDADGTVYIWDASTSPYGWIWMDSMSSRVIGKNTTYSAIQFCIGPANSDRTKWTDADIIDLETVPIIKDGANGANADVPMQAFQWNSSPITAPSPLPSGATLGNWSSTAPNRPTSAGEHFLWMTQTTKHTAKNGTVTYDNWSSAVRISGDKGDAGEDAKEREWIYIGKSEQTTFSGNTHPKNITTGTAGGQSVSGNARYTTDDFVPTGWSDNAIATDDTTNKFVYASWRDWNKTTQRWGDFNDPILWSNWGRQGIDGDGVQYIYKLFANELTDAQRTSEIPDNAIFNSTTGEWMPSGTSGKNSGWYDNPQATTQSTPFCYCSVIKKINGAWETLSTGKGKFGKLGLWSKWSADGTSPWVADLDNEMDSVRCNAYGDVEKAQSVRTTVSIYYGTASVGVKSVSVKRNGTPITLGTASSGVTVSFVSSTGVLTAAYGLTAHISGKDVFEITATANDGSNTTRVLYFTVNSTEGAIYNLKPSVREIVAQRQADGSVRYNGSYKFYPSCGYTKNDDGTITTVDDCPTGVVDDGKYYIFFSCRYKDTQTWEHWKEGTGVNKDNIGVPYGQRVNPSENYVNLDLYDAFELLLTKYGSSYTGGYAPSGNGFEPIDREIIHVVTDGADGANGANAVRIDLDNQADMIAVDADGKARFARTITVHARIYDGASSPTSGVTNATTESLVIGGCTPTTSLSGGVLTITWNFTKGTAAVTSIKTIILQYNNVSYSAVFTLTAQDTQAIYQLLPSRDSINFTRQADGSLTPDAVYPYCGYVKYTGSGAESHPLQYEVTQNEIFNFDNSGYAIWFRRLNADGTVYIWDASTSPYGWVWMDSMSSRVIGKNTTYSAIQFCIGPANRDRTKWTDDDIVDLETVPIIKDGANGTSPWVADLDNEMDSVSCDKSGYVNTNSFVRVSTNIGLYYGNSQKAIKYSTSTSGNYKTVTSVTVKRNGTTIPLNAFDALENKITDNVYLILASNYKTISVAYLSGAKITGKDDFEITIIAADDQSVQRTLHFTVNGIIGDVYNLLPSANEIIAIRNANGTFNTTGIKCGYTKRAVDGTITRVEDVDETHTDEPSGGYPLYVDGKYNIWYHRRVRSTGEWEKIASGQYAGRYGFEAYNNEGYRNEIVNNFNPNTYDAVEFILCTETGDYRAKEENKLIGEVDRETVYVVSNGSIPSYIETQEAWSNQPVATSTGPTDCNESDWKNSTPENTGNKAYLWRRSRQMTLNADGISYTPGTWTYIRLNGTNGTSINVKGSVKSVKDSSSSFPTSGVSTNDLAIVKTQAQLYKYNSSWSKSGPTAVDGDSYTNDDDRHLWMWSSEADKWIDLGEFKGESGKTYYTHVAWAKGITKGQQTARKPGQTNTPNATACTAFSISPMDGYDWMGILIDTDVNDASGTDAWKYYTWSYVQGPNGEDGENSIRLALDNQHEDFKYNDKGDLIAPTSGATSVIRLYDGETEVTNFTPQISAASGCTPSTSTSVADRAYISDNVLYVKGISQGSQSAWVRVMAYYNGEYYYAKFTANKTSGDKYDLFVTPSSIAYNSATYATQTISFEAKGTDDTGSQYDVTITSGSSTPAAGKFYIFYGYVQSDGKIVKPSNPSSRGVEQLTTTTFSVISDIASSYVGIYFVLRKYTDSTYYRVCDYETVEIAKSANGTNGTNGTNGKDGKDGWMVTANPANVIITQDMTTPSTFTTATVSFSAKKGSRTATITSVSVPNDKWYHFTGSVSNNQVTVSAPTKNNSNNYYTEGYFEATVNVTDPDTSSNVPFTVKVLCYANLLGTWTQTIENGVEKSISGKLSYELFGDYVHTINQEGQYIRGWAENTSILTKKVNSGKNMFSYPLTGQGWMSANSILTPYNITTVDDNWITVNSGHIYVVSPIVTLTKDVTYTLSFDVPSYLSGSVSIDFRFTSPPFTSITTFSVSGGSRRVLTFKPDATYSVRIYIQLEKIHYPQLEVNGSATPFDAGTTEITSQISQTADEIRLEVENTGIDITNGLISLRGGKVAIDESLSVPAVLSENDDMYTQINAGGLEIRSKTTKSYGLFEINSLGEVVLSMFDKDGKLIINIGGTAAKIISGEWIVCKLRPRNQGGDKDYYTTYESQCTTYYQLKLGYSYNARTGIKYYFPPDTGGNVYTVSSETFVVNYNNKVYGGTAYTELGVQGLSMISDGWYVKPNNGRFNVNADQQGPKNYWVEMYHYESGYLTGTFKQEFGF